MSTLNNCCKGLAAIVLIAASPVFVVYAAPLGYGLVGDLLDAAGGPGSLCFTTGTCLAALAWARYRAGGTSPEASSPSPVKSLG